MTTPLEAIAVRFGAEWTGGAVINRVVSDINRIVAAGKQSGDALSMIGKMTTGVESQDAKWRHIAASVLKYQQEIKNAEASIRQLGVAMALDEGVKGKKSIEDGAKALKDYVAQIDAAQVEINKAIPPVSGFGAAIASAIPYIVATGAALVGLSKGFQAWREAAEQGSQVRQLSESFQFLTQNIYEATGLITDMRAASKGTISDFSLMSSYLTLTAGTSEELGRKLTENAPRLLEIAKAANILNPALGDTTYFFESLARGIKRSEIRLIDNLGLIIKVGQAQRSYAESIGVSVRELTAEQKQIAIMNEVLRVGSNLIDQVGGKTDSLVDPYLQLAAGTENVKNAFREMASVTFEPVIEGLAGMATGLADMFVEAERTYQVIKDMSEINLAGLSDNVPVFDQGWQSAGANAQEYANAIRDLVRARADLGVMDVKAKDFISDNMVDLIIQAIGPLNTVNKELEATARLQQRMGGVAGPQWFEWTREAAAYKDEMLMTKAALAVMFGESVKFTQSAFGEELARITVNGETTVVSLSMVADAIREMNRARAEGLFMPGTEGTRDYWGDIDTSAQTIQDAISETWALMRKNKEVEEFLAGIGDRIDKTGKEAQGARSKIEEYADSLDRLSQIAGKVAREEASRAAGTATFESWWGAQGAISAERTAAIHDQWMQIFSGGELDSDLVVGDIENIGQAWITTNGATQEQLDKIAELNDEMERAREKVWDLEHGIGAQGDKAEATAKKLSDLNAEILNYETIIGGMQADIGPSTTTEIWKGLNLDDLAIQNQFMERFGETMGVTVEQLGQLGQGLGLFDAGVADAMQKTALLPTIMDNIILQFQAGNIDVSEIPAALAGAIAALEQDMPITEIELNLKTKIATNQQEMWDDLVRKGAPLPEGLGPTDLPIGANLEPWELALVNASGMADAQRPQITIDADTGPLQRTVDNVTRNIEGTTVILDIQGRYTEPDNMPGDGNPNPSPTPPVPPRTTPQYDRYGSWARGGYIPGGRGQGVVIRAHAGEFVMKPEAVDRLGIGFLTALNNGGRSVSNNVSVQTNFYAPVGAQEPRELVLRAGDDAAEQLVETLRRNGYSGF